MYVVTIKTDVREGNVEPGPFAKMFGPFEKRAEAEACVISLAIRADIKAAFITEQE